MKRGAFLMLIVTVIFAAGVSAQNDLPWPVWPDSSRHVLSALYGVWLINPGDPPFMHSGIDIAGEPGTPVYAVESGWVKTIMSPGEGFSSWRIVIGDSPGTDTCVAWMYAHIHQFSIPYTVQIGGYVEAGTYIGDIVDWPSLPEVVEHLHFSHIKYAGDAQQWANNIMDWIFIDNPLDFLIIDEDIYPPVLLPARDDSLLAFCGNESDIYFDPGSPVSGDVDIVCMAYDYHNFDGWRQVPYSIEYSIQGDSSIPWTMAACFTGEIGTYDQMEEYTYIVYQDDSVCNTTFDSENEHLFYFNLTNTDGDTLVEPSDVTRCWQTLNFPNGDYWVHVRARDKSGNETVDSMMVTVGNFFEIGGTVTLAGINPHPEGTIVTILSSGQTDTTNTEGLYHFDAAPPGLQTLSFSRSIYTTLDTSVYIDHDMEVSVILDIGEHLCGDANGDGTVNVGDAVFEISYVFKGGPPPDPPLVGDANCDGDCNVGDAVYLITHIFKSGPPPCPDCLAL